MTNTWVQRVRDQRIDAIVPLMSPALPHHELPLFADLHDTVLDSRHQVQQVLTGRDRRLLVVVGPCSVHDPAAAGEYASLLRDQAARLADDLLIVMRVYFEKPRSTVGWKGYINDPALDGSGDVGTGLRLARKLLLEVVGRGLPVAVEFLDPITPQYIPGIDYSGTPAILHTTGNPDCHLVLRGGGGQPNYSAADVAGALQLLERAD